MDLDPEKEFLDTHLTKSSRNLLHAIHGPFYLQILQKIILVSDLKNPFKKILETRKLQFLYE